MGGMGIRTESKYVNNNNKNELITNWREKLGMMGWVEVWASRWLPGVEQWPVPETPPG